MFSELWILIHTLRNLFCGKTCTVCGKKYRIQRDGIPVLDEVCSYECYEKYDFYIIPNVAGKFRKILKPYDYEGNKCLCPNCGDIGTPWGGWFSCESCPCIALVEDGTAYMPIKE